MEFDSRSSHPHLYGMSLDEMRYRQYYDPRVSSYLPDVRQQEQGYVPEDGYIDSVVTKPISHLDAITGGLDAPPSADPLDGFFAGKRDAIAGGVEDVLGLIYEREQLKYENLFKIDCDSCKVQGRLLPLEYWRPGINSEIDKVRTNIERELISLEREKRMEEVACWRDVARLRSELREVLQDFSRERARESLVSDLGNSYTPGL